MPLARTLALLVVATLSAACVSGARAKSPAPAAASLPTPTPTPKIIEPPAPPPKKAELPRGGRTIFPTHRLVGYCGTPGGPALGRLAGDLGARAKEIEGYGEKYASGRKVLPVFELIAVVVQGLPGADNKWRRRVPDSVVDEYLKAARAAKAILLINVQPGHSDFMTEVRAFEKYLREPDVGVAMDPEWAMKPKQKPGVYYGQSNGKTVNEVATYLSGIVAAGDLPEKVLVVHQMNDWVFVDEASLAPSPGVVTVKSVDGLGPKAAKIATYSHLMKSLPSHVQPGFKLFFDEDTQKGSKLMTPTEVLALSPEPVYVMYE
ncbi:MAG: hypothetical protein U0235_13345 [Polyangiaceae bacterium]